MSGVETLKFSLLLIAMFWNLENFFDPFKSSNTADEAFTPYGDYHWTWKKFVKKRDYIAKVIIAIGEKYGNMPVLIGVAEVENRFVMNQLVGETPLANVGYGLIHKESPDRRGIDVGLLYKREFFTPLINRFYPLKDGNDTIIKSRLILYVKGIINGEDTLHVFVNHWPSKLGNTSSSDKNRFLASNLVRTVTDSILSVNNEANIIVMGDFNDIPSSYAVKNLDNLVNLAENLQFPAGVGGTNKYKESWSLIDQFIVSKSLSDVVVMEVYSNNLLIDDNIYLGKKPFRTFVGPRYQGGISDHLPVILKCVNL